MHYVSALLAFLAVTSVSSLPLNINLGAFSPALVVGDGEISFGGEADVSNLMSALSGASQEASTTASIQRAGVENVSENGPKIVTAAPASETQPSASLLPQVQGIGRNIEPREPEADADTVNVEKEKRDVGEEKREVEERDLAGFNAALAFATGALKTGPEVQLGTGEGGSGVGIIVKAGTENGAAAEKVGKRAEGGLPTVTMIKLRTVGDSSSEFLFPMALMIR
jgi:hypothetical protein